MALLEIEATIRGKNQVTIPQAVMDRHGIAIGQRVVIVDSDVDDQFTVRVIRSSYAGALAGIFGSTEENVAYVRREREGWD